MYGVNDGSIILGFLLVIYVIPESSYIGWDSSEWDFGVLSPASLRYGGLGPKGVSLCQVFVSEAREDDGEIGEDGKMGEKIGDCPR